MTVQVLNTEGKPTGKEVTLPVSIFGIQPNDHAIYLAVKQYLANRRQGTAKTLERSEISGSTRKLHRQKGTGGSRKGSIKNPLFYGGPRVGGPRPRIYNFKLNKKVKDLARKSALSYKAKGNELLVIEDFSLPAPKTQQFFSILKNLSVADKKVLFLLSTSDENIIRSARNLPRTQVEMAINLNTYDILNAQILVMTESALSKIENMLLNTQSN